MSRSVEQLSDPNSLTVLMSLSHLLPAMTMGTRLGPWDFFPRDESLRVSGWTIPPLPPPLPPPPRLPLVSMICARSRVTSSNDSRLSTLNTKRKRSPAERNVIFKMNFSLLGNKIDQGNEIMAAQNRGASVRLLVVKKRRLVVGN